MATLTAGRSDMASTLEAANAPFHPMAASFCVQRGYVTEQRRGAEALPTLIHYKAYRIEAFERETDRWRAAISRLDGRPIKVAVPPASRRQDFGRLPNCRGSD
jgi:hypothetical protein